MPSFYDAYSIYGKDALSTFESLGVNDKVADWIRDLSSYWWRMELCYFLWNDSINEEIPDHLYGHGTTIPKKQQKPRDSVVSGVGSDYTVELPWKNMHNYIRILLKNYYAIKWRIRKYVSLRIKAAPWNEGDGEGVSRPSSLKWASI